MTTAEQRSLCAKFRADFVEVRDTDIAGVARNVSVTSSPIHGLRHLPTSGASGWYIWAGEYSDADDFFQPIHVAHLESTCPQILNFLALAPGWRFLIAGDQVDVWYDPNLLKA
ncbi:MAG TPA: hypothetical protein VGH02_09720 [Rhizomicrobium sp.]|jgi:hypothetical protein